MIIATHKTPMVNTLYQLLDDLITYQDFQTDISFVFGLCAGGTISDVDEWRFIDSGNTEDVPYLFATEAEALRFARLIKKAMQRIDAIKDASFTLKDASDDASSFTLHVTIKL